MVKRFLTDSDMDLEHLKREMLEKVPETQDSTYSQLAYTTFASYLSSASSMLSGYVWSKGGKGKEFGALQADVDTEKNKYKDYEQYLETVGNLFEQLQKEVFAYTQSSKD